MSVGSRVPICFSAFKGESGRYEECAEVDEFNERGDLFTRSLDGRVKFVPYDDEPGYKPPAELVEALNAKSGLSDQMPLQ